MSTFPTFSIKPDSKHYKEMQEDPAMRSDMEGGYVTSRPRFTRTPRRTFTIGYTTLSNADYETLKAFWDEVKGGSNKFTWTNEFTGETLTVRFMKYWSPKYAGMGGTRIWDVTGITFEEA